MSETTNREPTKSPKVGYGHPPERTRFKPGQSGNPRGRPKGTLNMATAVRRALREKVVIIKDGKQKKVTKLEAAAIQVADQAVAGDLRSVQYSTNLDRWEEERAVETAAPNADLEEADQKVLQGILERLATANIANQGGTNGSNETDSQ